MLPKDVLAIAREELNLNWQKNDPFYEPTQDEINLIGDWLLSVNAEKFPAVRRYVFYLKFMYETFWSIYTLFPKQKPGTEQARSEGKSEIDWYLLGTSPDEIIHLANYLYILDSYGVPGAVMECGCFKGFSSCCLSHACAFLGRELILADSFEGLPPNDRNDANMQGHVYQPGEFAGSLEEVQGHIALFGRPEVVKYVKGFYSESLKDWKKEIALLWLDVDLYDSAMDVMNNVFPALNSKSMLFSHEIREYRVKNEQFAVSDGPAGAFHDYLTNRDMNYKAKWIYSCLGQAGFDQSIGYGAAKFLETFRTHLRDADLHHQATRNHITHLEDVARSRQAEISQLQTKSAQQQTSIDQLQSDLVQKDKHIQELLNGRVMKTMLGVQTKVNTLLKNRNGR